MSDEVTTHGGAHAAQSGPDEHAHDEIHLPPNSWSPIALSIFLTATFIGFLVGPWLWGLGLALTIASLVAWLRAARAEFADLPD